MAPLARAVTTTERMTLPKRDTVVDVIPAANGQDNSNTAVILPKKTEDEDLSIESALKGLRASPRAAFGPVQGPESHGEENAQFPAEPRYVAAARVEAVPENAVVLSPSVIEPLMMPPRDESRNARTVMALPRAEAAPKPAPRSEPSPSVETTQPGRRRVLVIVGLAAIVLVVLGGSIVLLAGSSAKETMKEKTAPAPNATFSPPTTIASSVTSVTAGGGLPQTPRVDEIPRPTLSASPTRNETVKPRPAPPPRPSARPSPKRPTPRKEELPEE